MAAGEAAAGEGTTGGDAPAKPRKRKLIVAGAAVLLALGGGGGAYAFLRGTPAAQAEESHAAPAGGHGEDEAESFIDVPPMVVNLRMPDGAPHFLKLHVMLVPGAQASPELLKARLPLLIDGFQPFLRELRPEDLAGSAAVYRIKEEMLVRAHGALGEGQVTDVLIQDLVQQ